MRCRTSSRPRAALRPLSYGATTRCQQRSQCLLFHINPINAAAHELVRCRAWLPYGYCTLETCARDILDRSARWVHDLAALHDAVGQFPEIGSAISGADGGPALGQYKAMAIARVATAGTPGGVRGHAAAGCEWVTMRRGEPMPARKR
jgi:hypothetical protein